MAWEIIDFDGFISTRITPSLLDNIDIHNGDNLWRGSGDPITVVGDNYVTPYTTPDIWEEIMSRDGLELSYQSYIQTDHTQGCKLYINDPFFEMYFRYSPSANRYTLVVNSYLFAIDRNAQKAQVYYVRKNLDSWNDNAPETRIEPFISDGITGSSSATDTISTWLYNWILHHPLITYVWRSWSRLAGNGGQFNSRLPELKVSIADQCSPGDNHFFNTDDFVTIPTESSIWSTYLNALLGEEYTVAWSGNNRLTLTVTNSQSEPRDKIFTFKFYFGNTAAPFATFSENVRIGGDDPEDICTNFLLSFMYDHTEHVAAPLFLEYYAAETSYDYRSDAYTPWSDVTMQNLYTWLTASSSSPGGSGPYDTGTTDNGGTPSGGGHQDPMPTIHTPTLSGAAAGLFTIYCPTEAQLGSIADFLWSDNVLDNFKKYFNNFSDNIIALYVLPYKPANLPTKAFKVGTLESQDITAVEYVTTRFVSIPMGEITVGTRWDSYLDFEPYTKFSVYLPGIGVQALSADDIICPANMDESLPIAKGSKLSLEYVLDLMTGNVAAYIKINGQIRYQFTGKIGYSIPITGANYNSMVQGYVMATAGLIGTLATGGTAAPFAASAGAAGIINAMKPDVYRGGNLSGDSSSMCLQYPYLIRRRPNKPFLDEQEIYTGFPSYKSGTLSEFSGFTQVLDAHIEGISCTEAERAEILNLLKGGVIL